MNVVTMTAHMQRVLRLYVHRHTIARFKRARRTIHGLQLISVTRARLSREVSPTKLLDGKDIASLLPVGACGHVREGNPSAQPGVPSLIRALNSKPEQSCSVLWGKIKSQQHDVGAGHCLNG